MHRLFDPVNASLEAPSKVCQRFTRSLSKTLLCRIVIFAYQIIQETFATPFGESLCECRIFQYSHQRSPYQALSFRHVLFAISILLPATMDDFRPKAVAILCSCEELLGLVPVLAEKERDALR